MPGPNRRVTKNRFADILRSVATKIRATDPTRIPLATELERVAQQRTNFPVGGNMNGYVSGRDAVALEAVLRNHGIQRPQPTSNESLRDQEERAGFVHEIDEDSDGGDDNDTSASGAESQNEEDDAAARERFLHFSPTQPNQDDAPEVQTAYNLISDLRSGFPHAINFDLVPVLRRVYQNVRAGQQTIRRNGRFTLDDTQIMLGGGRCQSQKTPLKAAQILMCRLLGVATIVLTTGVSGREDLFKKFTTFLSPMLSQQSLYQVGIHS